MHVLSHLNFHKKLELTQLRKPSEADLKIIKKIEEILSTTIAKIVCTTKIYDTLTRDLKSLEKLIRPLINEEDEKSMKISFLYLKIIDLYVACRDQLVDAESLFHAVFPRKGIFILTKKFHIS